MKRTLSATVLALVALAGCSDQHGLPTDPQVAPQLARSAARSDRAIVGVNVLLASEPDEQMLDRLGEFGGIRGILPEIDAVLMQARAADIPAIQGLPFVAAAGPDAPRQAQPVDDVPIADFAGGGSTWNLDAVNVTEIGVGNRLALDGEGVYVGIIDSGLLDTWRRYFPDERIATEYARSFEGGGLAGIQVAQQPNRWEHDTRSHGTHVTSTVLGFRVNDFAMNGVAPNANVIPIMLSQGASWSSTIAASVLYLTALKMGPLQDHPLVVNMSFSGYARDAVEQAAIDYAISQGLIFVAAAGNSGTLGMVYPAAYEPVISVAATGVVAEWADCGFGSSQWWWSCDIADPTDPSEHYVAPFSSRAQPGQDLDVAAPGSWVLGPWQVQMGKLSWYFVSGTSMASPHVAGIVALMAQKKNDLTASEAEAILESTATPLPGWGPEATGSGLVDAAAALAATP